MSRVALITGGMGGLGEAICIKMAALGYKVVTTYSPGNAKAADWLKNMNNMGYGFMAYPCDVTDFDSAKACVEAVTQEVGPVDVLVNNAGITRDMTFKKMTKADWAGWLKPLSGEQRAPRKPGNAKYKPIEPAPGRYVKERAV